MPSPLSHLLVDYRNLRTTMIRQAYADSYNTQAKLICSYNSVKSMYNVSEGNPILNGEGWFPQQRLGFSSDSNLPVEMEANAYARDAVAENIVGAKSAEHKPVIYTLPKNTTLEPQQKLESILDISMMQVRWIFLMMCTPVLHFTDLHFILFFGRSSHPTCISLTYISFIFFDEVRARLAFH